ncbi:MAG: hypothetical protein AB1505_02805 [Candidatus Latescibacterota bacterium]
MQLEASDLRREVNALVDQYRTRCLWFLREDHYLADHEDLLRILGYIKRYGDLEAFRRASRLGEWLSHHSSAQSAV